MITNFNQAVIRTFEKQADRRGYTDQTKSDYVAESFAANKKASTTNDAVLVAMTAATGGKILHTAIKAERPFKTAFKKAAKSQIKPLKTAMDQSLNNMEKILNTKSFAKALPQAVLEGFKQPLRLLQGAFMSVPKPVRIAGAALIALTTLKFQVERHKSEAKYDTVQYLKDNAS